MKYDTIIVGSGSAGGILAARLTEDAHRSVLLLEAGPDFPTLEQLPDEIRFAYGHDPNLWARAFGHETKFGWGYNAKATEQHPDMLVPRGKLVGGSSAVNAQIFLRGVPEDYDSWAEMGNDKWSYRELIPYFRRNEADPDFHDDFHGADGAIRVRRFREGEFLPEQQAFYDACRARGYPDCPDNNAPDSTGVGALALNNVDGVRWSTAIGYLNPARHRVNLTIKGNCTAHRVLFEGNRAVGVSVESGGEMFRVNGGEIIVCAGAIGSPHLLMLSGIGPAEHLRKIGIPVVHDIPGVGQNLRDHPQVTVALKANKAFLTNGTEPRLQMGLRYTASGSDLRNDMFILPASYATKEGYYRISNSKTFGFYITVCIYLAVGAGEITLASSDPHEQPVLDYNYLAESFDRDRLREAVRMAIDFTEYEAYEEIVSRRVAPTNESLMTDEALDEWLMREVTTSHHSSSTCKMGPESDPMAVVDQYGKVYGIEGLRVADASIMPDCIRANTNVTTMVIGERVADFVR